MNQNESMIIDPYIEGGNVIYPNFHLSMQPGIIIGIYTDVSKIHTLIQWFAKRSKAIRIHIFVKMPCMSD